MRGEQDHRPVCEALVDPDTGEVLQPPQFYLLPKALTPSDPFDEVQLQGGLTSSSLRHRLYGSRRLAQPTRWLVDASAVGGATAEILVRGVNGAGIATAEFLTEDQYQGSSRRFAHNPTHCGGSFKQFFGQTCTAALQRAMHPPPVLHMVHRTNGREILFEAATIPLEFNTDGYYDSDGDHGGGRDTALAWWRHKQFLRLQLVDDIMHGVSWRYSPVSWEANGNGLRDVSWQGVFPFSFQNLFREQAEFFDPLANRSFDMSATWAASTVQQLFRGRLTGFEQFGDVAAPETALPLSGTLLGAIFSTPNRFAGGLAIGMLAQLARYTESDRGRTATFIDMQEI